MDVETWYKYKDRKALGGSPGAWENCELAETTCQVWRQLGATRDQPRPRRLQGAASA